MIQIYKHVLLLHKIYNNENTSINWVDLFFTQQFNHRDPTVKFYNTSTYKVGNSLLTNRFTVLNGKIALNWLNDSFESYKIKYKNLFMSHS